MRLTYQVTNTTGIVANLHRRDAILQQRIREINVSTMEEALSIGKQICPKRTTYMSEMLKGRVSEAQLAWSIGWRREDFEGVINPYNGQRMTFYPPLVDMGTSSSAAQPTLGPTMTAVRRSYNARVRNAVNASLARRV